MKYYIAQYTYRQCIQVMIVYRRPLGHNCATPDARLRSFLRIDASSTWHSIHNFTFNNNDTNVQCVFEEEHGLEEK